jgi:hypothetical protein
MSCTEGSKAGLSVRGVNSEKLRLLHVIQGPKCSVHPQTIPVVLNLQPTDALWRFFNIPKGSEAIFSPDTVLFAAIPVFTSTADGLLTNIHFCLEIHQPTMTSTIVSSGWMRSPSKLSMGQEWQTTTARQAFI